jgi:hypothetical protein
VAAVEPVAAAPKEADGAAAQALMQAGVQFLEALAAALNGPGTRVINDPQTGQPALLVPVPAAQLVQRGTAALQAIVQALGQQGPR